ncbi:acyl carrier protein [Nitrospinae bacterium AH_259_B05_G02_I21]|nr:acyl carrier protein [Nitrospinae bacterium AH_259_B05_G02_I21]
MDNNQVFDEVRAIILEALGVDEKEVELKTRLIEELDAESLDFLDIVFRLERSFGIKIPRGEIERNARGGLSDEEFEDNGMVTPEGLEALQRVMPEVDPIYFKDGLAVRDIPRLFTVETFYNIILAKLAEQGRP